jgi:Zn-finger nucleic acid-binding protein
VPEPIRICPGCEQPMQLYYAKDVELERCGQCGGLWFNWGELEAVTGRDLEPEPLGGETSRRCAYCRITLVPGVLPGGVPVESCTACRGIYLDAGELTELGIDEPPAPVAERDAAGDKPPPYGASEAPRGEGGAGRAFGSGEGGAGGADGAGGAGRSDGADGADGDGTDGADGEGRGSGAVGRGLVPRRDSSSADEPQFALAELKAEEAEAAKRRAQAERTASLQPLRAFDSFACVKCGQRFPFRQGNALKQGLACRACAPEPAKAPPRGSLQRSAEDLLDLLKDLNLGSGLRRRRR